MDSLGKDLYRPGNLIERNTMFKKRIDPMVVAIVAALVAFVILQIILFIDLYLK